MRHRAGYWIESLLLHSATPLTGTGNRKVNIVLTQRSQRERQVTSSTARSIDNGHNPLESSACSGDQVRDVTNKASGTISGIAADCGMQTSGRFGLNYAISDELILKTEYEKTWIHGGKDTYSHVPRAPIQVYSAALSAVF